MSKTVSTMKGIEGTFVLSCKQLQEQVMSGDNIEIVKVKDYLKSIFDGSFRVTTLQNICRQLSLKVSGVKKQLCQRIAKEYIHSLAETMRACSVDRLRNLNRSYTLPVDTHRPQLLRDQILRFLGFNLVEYQLSDSPQTPQEFSQQGKRTRSGVIVSPPSFQTTTTTTCPKKQKIQNQANSGQKPICEGCNYLYDQIKILKQDVKRNFDQALKKHHDYLERETLALRNTVEKLERRIIELEKR